MQIIIPAIEKEVNDGKSFAAVRQAYSAEIMATWFKKTLRESLLGQVFANKSKIAGQKVSDPQAREKIYQQYLRAYKKGVFNYIREDATPDGQTIPRKYFSGGAMPVAIDLVKPVPANNPEVGAFVGNVEKAMKANRFQRFLMAGVGLLVFGVGAQAQPRVIQNPFNHLPQKVETVGGQIKRGVGAGGRRIAGLGEATINEGKAGAKSIDGRIQTDRDLLNKANGTIASLRTQLQQKQAALDAEIATNAANATRIAQLNAEIKALNNRINEQNTAFVALQQKYSDDLAAQRANLDTQRREADAREASLTGEINKLRDQMKTAAADQQAALQKQIDRLRDAQRQNAKLRDSLRAAQEKNRDLQRALDQEKKARAADQQAFQQKLKDKQAEVDAARKAAKDAIQERDWWRGAFIALVAGLGLAGLLSFFGRKKSKSKEEAETNATDATATSAAKEKELGALQAAPPVAAPSEAVKAAQDGVKKAEAASAAANDELAAQQKVVDAQAAAAVPAAQAAASIADLEKQAADAQTQLEQQAKALEDARTALAKAKDAADKREAANGLQGVKPGEDNGPFGLAALRAAQDEQQKIVEGLVQDVAKTTQKRDELNGRIEKMRAEAAAAKEAALAGLNAQLEQQTNALRDARTALAKAKDAADKREAANGLQGVKPGEDNGPFGLAALRAAQDEQQKIVDGLTQDIANTEQKMRDVGAGANVEAPAVVAAAPDVVTPETQAAAVVTEPPVQGTPAAAAEAVQAPAPAPAPAPTAQSADPKAAAAREVLVNAVNKFEQSQQEAAKAKGLSAVKAKVKLYLARRAYNKALARAAALAVAINAQIKDLETAMNNAKKELDRITKEFWNNPLTYGMSKLSDAETNFKKAKDAFVNAILDALNQPAEVVQAAAPAQTPAAVQQDANLAAAAKEAVAAVPAAEQEAPAVQPDLEKQLADAQDQLAKQTKAFADAQVQLVKQNQALETAQTDLAKAKQAADQREVYNGRFGVRPGEDNGPFGLAALRAVQAEKQKVFDGIKEEIVKINQNIEDLNAQIQKLQSAAATTAATIFENLNAQLAGQAKALEEAQGQLTKAKQAADQREVYNGRFGVRPGEDNGPFGLAALRAAQDEQKRVADGLAQDVANIKQKAQDFGAKQAQNAKTSVVST